MTEVERRDKAPKKKGRKKPLTPLQEADRLAGAIVRSRGVCRLCGATQGLQWAHLWSRGYRKIRHDLRNAWCLCASCHMKYTMNPIAWDDVLRAELGEPEYTRLRLSAIEGPRAVVRESVKLLELECARLGLVDVLADIYERRAR